MTAFLQASMFCSSWSSFISLRTLSIHLCLGLPRGLFPPTSIFLISFATFLWSLLRRVHTDNFTRRAYRSRTVRVGFLVYTLRPLRRVRPVHSDHFGRCSQWTRTVRVGLAVQRERASGRVGYGCV